MSRKLNLKNIFIVSLLILTAYSFFPMIFFLFTAPAGNDDNNQANAAKLRGNAGFYFSFIVFGDNHAGLIFNDASALKLIWNMNREDRFRKVPLDFVLSAGDVSLNGKERHFTAYKKLQNIIKYPVIAAIGNHDDRELFKKYCGDPQFAFPDRNSYFIVVDNEGGPPDFEWLEKELEKGKSYSHIFIVMHKPPFDPYQRDWYNADSAPWAYKFRKLCSENKVDMVFSGHKHMFARRKFDGVENIVTGGGGMLIEIPEANGGYLNYVRVVVNHEYVTYEVRKVSPPLWLHMTYYLGKEALYWIRNWYGSGYISGRDREVFPPRIRDMDNYEYWFNEKGNIKED
ncbi:MAG: metallophosphoesterase [Candidatus Omnitrophota bacterium]